MKTEKVLASIALLGILFRLMHWPGGAFLLIIAIGILSMVYFPFGFYFLSGRTIQQQSVPLSLGVGMGLSTTIVGILFKLMHWPGALVMLIVGNVTVVVLWFVVRALDKKNQDESLVGYYKNMMVRMTVIGGWGLALMVTSLLRLRFGF